MFDLADQCGQTCSNLEHASTKQEGCFHIIHNSGDQKYLGRAGEKHPPQNLCHK